MIYEIFQHGKTQSANKQLLEDFKNEISKFKLFTFSNLKINDFKLVSYRLQLNSEIVDLVVSMYSEELSEHQINEIFIDKKIQIGDSKSSINFNISSIEIIKEPKFNEVMIYKTLSPLLISFKYPGQTHASYLTPENKNFSKNLFKSLINKYKAYHEPVSGKKVLFSDFDLKYENIKKPKSSLVTIKAGNSEENRMKAYSAQFKITAPVELQKMGYYSGFGQKNSLGFGCCELI